MASMVPAHGTQPSPPKKGQSKQIPLKAHLQNDKTATACPQPVFINNPKPEKQQEDILTEHNVTSAIIRSVASPFSSVPL
jgi:hypothetical protein